MNAEMIKILSKITPEIKPQSNDGRYHSEETLERVDEILKAIKDYANYLRSTGNFGSKQAADMQSKMLDSDYLDLFEVKKCLNCGKICPAWETDFNNDICEKCYERKYGPREA